MKPSPFIVLQDKLTRKNTKLRLWSFSCKIPSWHDRGQMSTINLKKNQTDQKLMQKAQLESNIQNHQLRS